MLRSAIVFAALGVSLGAGLPARAAAPAPRPRVDEGSPRGGGSISAARLGAFGRARRPMLTACYEKALRQNPSLRGAMRVRFTIGEDGAIDRVEIVQNAVGEEVGECVASVIRSWRTPFRPAGPVEVELPLRFAPGE